MRLQLKLILYSEGTVLHAVLLNACFFLRHSPSDDAKEGDTMDKGKFPFYDDLCQ